MLTEPFDTSEAHALRLDQQDPLKEFRGRFFVPPETIYLDGNSLGLMSRDAQASLEQTAGEWRDLAIRGWLEAKRPWFYLAERLGAKAAPLVGAQPDAVVATGTTTVNLHALVATLFEPRGARRKILADALNFPSDLYALEGQLRLRGLDPDADLVLVQSADGRTLQEDDIIEHMTEEVALVLLPSVLYRSGQLLDMERLTRAAHDRGIPIGFDCSHSVGAVRHSLDAWGVDFAVWCSYKYLNGGPGCCAFIYLNERHADRRPGLPGWFGYRKDKQFEMRVDFEPQRGAAGLQISSPGVLGSSTLDGALDLMHEAGIDRIEDKSNKLTSYLIQLVDELLTGSPYDFVVGTPREPSRRSGHVALERYRDAYRIAAALRARGVIPDFRPPATIRVAPIALYNTFHEVWKVVDHLRAIVDQGEHHGFDEHPAVVP